MPEVIRIFNEDLDDGETFFYSGKLNAIEEIYRYGSGAGTGWLEYADIALNDEVEIIDYINTKEE